MRRKPLAVQLSIGFSCIVLVTIALISLVSNLLINRQFNHYVEKQQQEFADSLPEALANTYDMETDTWNVGYIHGTGMYALNDGYIIKIYDTDGAVIWDAENHDMEACHQIMGNIEVLMEERRPELKGEFVTKRYDLKQINVPVGTLEVSYYSPFYLNENAFQFLDALNQILIVIGVTALAGSILAACILAGQLSRPLAKTISMTKKISEGNYRIRFEAEPKTAELYELMANVNYMAQSLEQQELLRRQMTTDAAHELKTPLAIVSAYLEAMLEGVWEPTAERLQSCHDEIGHITQLVTDLQRLSQMENDSLTLKKEPVELKSFAAEIAAYFESQFHQRKLVCEVIGDASTVSADRNKLWQAVTNLVSNAIKYSDEGTEIKLIVTDEKEYGTLIVADQGVGIPSEEQKMIFERFYRVDKSHNRKTGGSGIGLAIVKAVVMAHDGNVEVKSEEGRGSRFRMMIPKGR